MGAHSAYTVDLSGQNTESKVLPKNLFNPATLEIRGNFGSIQIIATDEQLAEIEYDLRTYLDGIRYPETPDQQAALNHEITKSIEEEIA
ncbi:hypothetical protein D3C74_140550 [compost metagenome]